MKNLGTRSEFNSIGVGVFPSEKLVKESTQHMSPCLNMSPDL